MRKHHINIIIVGVYFCCISEKLKLQVSKQFCLMVHLTKGLTEHGLFQQLLRECLNAKILTFRR